MEHQPYPTPRVVRWVVKISDVQLMLERHLASFLMTLLVILILLNVVTRYSGFPIYWVDEAAVYTVVWLTFIGASITTRLRLDFAVTMVSDLLGGKSVKRMKIVATACVVLFGLSLLAMCWVWMDPVGIIRHGFDAKEYAAESFNFLYTEHTQTLEWPMWVLQLIMPIFALGFTIHATANLLEDMGLSARREYPEFGITSPDAVN
jgi:TRAP-type C4-dicarboxylate transport system permease small subunit